MKANLRKQWLQRLISLVTMLAVLTASFCISGIFVSAAGTGIAIDETNFPDANLRKQLSNKKYDLDKDGYFSDDEIASLTKLSLTSYEISSLEGIEIFYNLETLYCGMNYLTEIDVSSFPNLQLLSCYKNSLTELNISNNPLLTTLECYDNSITTLDISNNPLLTSLTCDETVTVITESHTHSYDEYSYDDYGHWRVCTTCGVKETSEDHTLVDNVCTVCGYVYTEEEDDTPSDIPLTTEYFPDSNAIKYVFSTFDTNSDSVLSQEEREAVTVIKFTKSYISDVTGIEYFPNVTQITITTANVLSVDLSKNKLLEKLYCTGTSLTSLDLRGNPELILVDCSASNLLTEINVSTCSNLSSLNCSGTAITALDLSNNPLLNESNVTCDSSVSIIWYSAEGDEQEEEDEPEEDPEEPEETLIQTAYVNVSVEGDLSMYFAFAESDLAGDDYIACISKGNDEVTEIPLEDWFLITISDEEYYCIEYDGIAAKEMCEDVTIQIFSGDEAVSEAYTESIQSYAMRVLENSSNDSLKSVMVDLLNYGSAAQCYFVYDTDNLANALLTDEQSAYASSDISLASEDETDSSPLYLGASLTLESSITLSMLFDITPDEGTMAVVEYTAYDGTDISKTITDFEAYTADDGTVYYAVSIDSLSVADVATEITCTIYDGDTEIVTVSDSQGSYISRNLGQSDELDALLNSLLRFGQSVCNYLGYGD